MSDLHYEDASNVLRVYLEDHRKSALEDDWDLQVVLTQALTIRYLSRNIPESIAKEAAEDDASSLVANLDTLRPILEHYWRNN